MSIVPSVMRKRPGNLDSQGLLAAGTYWRELASMAATLGMGNRVAGTHHGHTGLGPGVSRFLPWRLLVFVI